MSLVRIPKHFLNSTHDGTEEELTEPRHTNLSSAEYIFVTAVRHHRHRGITYPRMMRILDDELANEEKLKDQIAGKQESRRWHG